MNVRFGDPRNEPQTQYDDTVQMRFFVMSGTAERDERN
jgi:hypothetical protein